MKALLKLAVVAILANATWHLWGVYSAHFQFNGAKPEQEVRARILDLAAQYDVPVTEANFTLRREEDHTIADGSYIRPVELFPGFQVPFTFNWHVDTLTLPGALPTRR
jgi:hypothetical protein